MDRDVVQEAGSTVDLAALRWHNRLDERLLLNEGCHRCARQNSCFCVVKDLGFIMVAVLPALLVINRQTPSLFELSKPLLHQNLVRLNHFGISETLKWLGTAQIRFISSEQRYCPPRGQRLLTVKTHLLKRDVASTPALCCFWVP